MFKFLMWLFGASRRVLYPDVFPEVATKLPETAPPPPKDPAPLRTTGTPWLVKAASYIGVHEIPGAKDEFKIVRLWKQGGIPLSVDDDETPWCAAFVSAMLELTGIPSAKSGWALDYANYGKKLSGPAVGCIAVFRRKGGGHVGFVVGRTKNDQLVMLGGNQDDEVKLSIYDEDKAIAYRWPSKFALPDKTGLERLPYVTANTYSKPLKEAVKET